MLRAAADKLSMAFDGFTEADKLGRGDVDVVVLSPDAQPLPGWLQQLAACLARDAAIATATPWCNAGETAAWPRLACIALIAAGIAGLKWLS